MVIQLKHWITEAPVHQELQETFGFFISCIETFFFLFKLEIYITMARLQSILYELMNFHMLSAAPCL